MAVKNSGIPTTTSPKIRSLRVAKTQIENGELDTPKTRTILEIALQPMMEKGVDRVVMGCTHYPFVIPVIQDIVGPKVDVIDPAPAVARQTGRLLDAQGLRRKSNQTGNVKYLTTKDSAQLNKMLLQLLGNSGDIESVSWVGGRIFPSFES